MNMSGAQNMKTIRALVPIEHDGKRIEAGEEAEIQAEAVPALVACGAAEDITKPAKPSKGS